MSAPQIDLDKLEQAAKASQEHSVATGSTWWEIDDVAMFASEEDASFIVEASPDVVLELISRLRTAEENYQAATLRANANAEMLKGLQSQSPAVMNVSAVAAVLACEIEAGIYEEHVAPALQVAWKVASERQQQADRDAIRRIFMGHGFTIKEGQTDLKPYVFEAAEALLRELSPAVAAPDKPIVVFDKGPWIWTPTGEEFSGQQLDEAAFHEYRCKLFGNTAPESGSQQ